MEAILSHKDYKGQTSFLIKWKDHSREEIWVSKQKAAAICLELLNNYIAEIKAKEAKRNEVRFRI